MGMATSLLPPRRGLFLCKENIGRKQQLQRLLGLAEVALIVRCDGLRIFLKKFTDFCRNLQINVEYPI